MGSLETRLIDADEVDEFMLNDSRAFGWQPEREFRALWRPAVQPERSVAVFDDGEIVGTAVWNPYDMVVPGGTLVSAGVTEVGVQPTHRRRGLLTSMMRHQLDQLRELGIPLAGLTASESIIYGRFGYGIASFEERWSIQRQHTVYATPFEPKGRLSFISPDRIKGIFPEVEGRALSNRPGSVQKPGYEWDIIAADPESNRSGASAYFHVAYEHDGRVDGYVIYRTKGEAVQVEQLMAATDDAYSALWRYCFDIDLRETTTAHTRPVDDPLVWMLADPRRLKREVHDGLWLRLVDVAQALSGRAYSQEGSLVLRVVDTFCPWNEGTFELEASSPAAECRRSSKPPGLVLSAADLAAAFLGGQAFSTLARAGRVEECRPGALEQGDSMFAHRPLPWSPYGY